MLEDTTKVSTKIIFQCPQRQQQKNSAMAYTMLGAMHVYSTHKHTLWRKISREGQLRVLKVSFKKGELRKASLIREVSRGLSKSVEVPLGTHATLVL